MGRKKKSLIEKSPFKLRHRKLADGRLSLFLDRSVDGGHEYEFLQLYLMPETSAKARRQNAQTLRKAEDIQRERTEALLNAKVGTVPESKSSDMLQMSGSVMWTDSFTLIISTGFVLPARPHGENRLLPRRLIPIIPLCVPL